MTLEILQKEMISAMKEKNKIKKQVLADIIATAKNMAIEKKQKDNVTEEIIDAAALKVNRIAQEQFDACPNDREELKAEYEEYLSYSEKYVPVMMSAEEIAAEVDAALATFTDIPKKGMLMKVLMPKLKGKADGKLVNQIVEDKLK